MKQHQENSKDFYPIILTLVLFLAALIVFVMGRLGVFANIGLWLPICLYALIDIGFIVALILGVKSKNVNVKIFSAISNMIFCILISIYLLLLLIAVAIAGPN
nr:hypothetical protein [uncultured Bacillus sp.]